MISRKTFALGLGALPLTARVAEAQTAPVVNVGVGATDSSGLALYAYDLGMFRDAGLDIHVNIMGNTGNVISAAVGGAFDIAAANLGNFAVAKDHGVAIHLIASGGVYSATSPTALLLVPTDSPAKSPADLNGKIIAVNGLRADISMFETQSYLDRNGADSKTMKYLEVPFPEMGVALAQHRVDCAFVIEPFLTAAKKNARIFADPSTGIAPHFQTSALFATDAWLANNADAARRFAAVIRQAARWANSHHKESGEILVRYAKLDPVVAATMHRQEYGLSLEPALIQPVFDAALRYDVIRNPLTAAEVIWNGATR
jgi:NitT/TauT family transport system substrate-binding protein